MKDGVIISNYAYDSNSNRIGGNIGSETTTATYDDQDRLVSYNGAQLTYNANGELLTKRNASFTYDLFGNLKQYKKGNLTLAYEVDPLQRRMGRLVNGSLTTRYVYNPEGQVVGQMDEGGRLLKTFIYATKSHVPDYYIDQSGRKFRIITDHLGSVRLVVSNSGRVLQLMEHDEFGRVIQDTRPGFLPFGFAGGLYEHRTGLVRFGVRDYDPETGRWTSKDPIRFDGQDTNLYGYVLQDPINYIDPTGLINWTKFGAGLAQTFLGGAVSVGSIGLGGLVTTGSGFVGTTVGVGIGVGGLLGGIAISEGGINKVIEGWNEPNSCSLKK